MRLASVVGSFEFAARVAVQNAGVRSWAYYDAVATADLFRVYQNTERCTFWLRVAEEILSPGSQARIDAVCAA